MGFRMCVEAAGRVRGAGENLSEGFCTVQWRAQGFRAQGFRV